MMNANALTGDALDTAMEDFAAELAETAYAIVLRNAPVENWLDLELELWRTLRKAVGEWAQDWPQAGVMFVPAMAQEHDAHELRFNRHC
jgi:hypothetical protein